MSDTAIVKSFFKYLFFISVVLSPFALRSQATQSFSYTPPLCTKAGTIFPQLSSGWQGGGSFFAIGGINVNSFSGSLDLTNAVAGTYTIVYTGGLCACTVTTSIQVFASPSIAIAGNSVCAGAEYPITISVTPSTNISYTWNIDGSNSNTISVPGSNFFTTLIAINQAGCKSTTPVNLFIFNPVVPIIIGNTNACSGTTVSLIANLTAGVNYTWSTGVKNIPSINVSPSSTSVYSLNSIDSRGCKGARSHTITVIHFPSFSVSNASVCEGFPVELKVQNPTPGVTYIWQPSSIKGTSILVSPQNSFTYAVTGNFLGCQLTKTLSVAVRPLQRPKITVTYPNPICSNTGIVFPTKPAGSGVFLADSIVVDSISGGINTDSNVGGIYNILFSAPASSVGCIAGTDIPVVVEIVESEPLKISPEITIVEGERTQLEVTGGGNYRWTPNEFLSCSDCATPWATPPVNTEYCVVSNVSGCIREACSKINVVCAPGSDHSVPNAFTPDGDHNNDVFCLRGWKRCNNFFNVKIFNRWGTLLFESDDTDFCWDGYYNGVLLDPEVYVYVITASFNNEDRFVRSGNITLIR